MKLETLQRQAHPDILNPTYNMADKPPPASIDPLNPEDDHKLEDIDAAHEKEDIDPLSTKNKIRISDAVAEMIGGNPDAMRAKQAGEDTTEKDKIAIPRDPSQNPDTPKQGDLFVSKVKWKRDLEVTADDKAAYQRAMLFDEKLELNLKFLEGKLIVTVVGMTAFEESMCIEAVNKDAVTRGGINTLALHNELQIYAVAIMIRKVNGKDAEHCGVELPSDMPEDEAIDKLYAASKKIKNFGARKDILIQTTMMFNEKKSQMQEEIFNGDFWIPED